MMKRTRLTIGAVMILGVAIVHTPAMAATIVVRPGGQFPEFGSIQDGVDAASPQERDTVIVHPGIYHEAAMNPDDGAAVTINKPLTLQAVNYPSDPDAGTQVILEPNPGHGQHHGILVQGEKTSYINGFSISGFTVRNFPNNGIELAYVENYTIENNWSENNLENGIFPTLSASGWVQNNVAYGSLDSALWVEASTDVHVINNQLHDSVTGLEVTISNDVEMTNNHVYHNVTGVGLYHPSAAGLQSEVHPGAKYGNWILSNNTIYDNNLLPNPAPPGSMPAALPSGGGVLVLGVDKVSVMDNTITGNDFYGIAVLDWCTAVTGQSFDCTISPPQVDPYPDGNSYGGNTVWDNGTKPPSVTDQPFAPFAADLTDFVMTRPPDTSLPGDHINLFCDNYYLTKKFPEELLFQPYEQRKCPPLPPNSGG